MSRPPRVLIWNEGLHDQHDPEVAAIYPEGMHGALAAYLTSRGLTCRTATLEEPEHGLSERALAESDVLLWWGHRAHDQVADEIVDRIQRRVLDGMGFIPLHSAHYSKPFIRLMGTRCSLRWRAVGERERLWVVSPGHPIAAGIDPWFEIEPEEMYGEPFDIPPPDDLVFISWFEGGEVFRSGACYNRGRGRIFYFRPGHESYPTYHHPQVLKVIENAVHWAAPSGEIAPLDSGQRPEPLEPLDRGKERG